MKVVRKIVQWSVRLGFLATAIGLAIGGPLPGILARVIPGLSPLTVFASSLAQRRWYVGIYWLGPPLVVLLLSLWKGRLFCRWICPAGTVYAMGSKLSLKKRLLKVRLNAYLFWMILGASIVGAPLLLFLDPLSSFNRLSPLLRGTATLASLVPGLVLPIILLLGFVQPLIWCGQICPLGYFFELTRSIRNRPIKTFINSRRQIVAALAVGITLGGLGRLFAFGKRSYKQAPVLPPGAKDMETFASICTRCYACVDTCPYGIIVIRFDLDRAPGQYFQPELRYVDSELPGVECGYCAEWCNACTQVCPTGALMPLDSDQKQHRQIGQAEIIRDACLAWQDEQDCSVCQEVCPYQAIDLDQTPDGRARPIVNKALCRGCGACFSSCPAIRKGKAIIIRGVERQRVVDV